MHKLRLFFLVHFFTIMVLIVPSYGADVIKIGVLDTQKVLDTSLLGKKMKNELKKIHRRFSDDLDAREKQIEKLQGQIDILSGLKQPLSEADEQKLENKNREKNFKIYDAKNLEKKYQNEFNTEEMNRLKYVTNIVEKIVAEIGRKEGYILIKNKRGTLFSSDERDLTDRVIKILNSRYKEGKYKGPKKKPQ
jgi:outer membrane protein